MRDTIRTILAEWQERKLPLVIDRETNLLDYAGLKVPKIVVVTGFRRVGKTYLMLQLAQNLLKDKTRKNIVYLNFEDERIPFKTEFLSMLLPALRQFLGNKIEVIFLDEIQDMPNWSKWLRRLYDSEDIRIFVSGSSSKMSSMEIPTELRGRFLEVRLLPLSFREFLNFKNARFDLTSTNHSDNQKAALLNTLNEFLEYGSLPEIVLSDEAKKIETAQSYYQTFVRRDIIERHKIKNEEALKALLRLLLNSTKYSISKLYNTLKSMNYEIGKSTLQHYLSCIEQSYFLFSVPIFSYKAKDQMQYPRRVYFIDNIFISKISDKFSKDSGRLYENAVAVELKRRKKEIYYWANQKKEEVDFVIKDGTKVSQLVQVCYDISNPETKKREINVLIKASRELKCSDLLILTEDREEEKEFSWFGTKRRIRIMPLWKWLLGIKN